MTHPTLLKITQGKMEKEIRKRGSHKPVGTSAWKALNVIYPSKAENVLAGMVFGKGGRDI